MDFDELKKDYTLQQHEGRVQAALDSNKGMIEFSKMSLRGATILNGTAAVAIIYSKQVWWYSAALWFGGGAFLAVLATGMTYLTQWLLFETWRPALMGGVMKITPVPPETIAQTRGDRRELSTVVRLQLEADPPYWTVRYSAIGRVISIILVLISFVFFGLGLFDAYSLLEQQPTIAPQEP